MQDTDPRETAAPVPLVSGDGDIPRDEAKVRGSLDTGERAVDVGVSTGGTTDGRNSHEPAPATAEGRRWLTLLNRWSGPDAPAERRWQVKPDADLAWFTSKVLPKIPDGVDVLEQLDRIDNWLEGEARKRNHGAFWKTIGGAKNGVSRWLKSARPSHNGFTVLTRDQQSAAATWANTFEVEQGTCYPWVAGSDNRKLDDWLAAAQVDPADPGAGIDRLRLAVRSYLRAAKAGATFPAGPPTTHHFTREIARWLMTDPGAEPVRSGHHIKTEDERIDENQRMIANLKAMGYQ